MKFKVSPRLKLPCMPWPWRSTVSAIWNREQSGVGWSYPDDQERNDHDRRVRHDRLALEAKSCDIGSVPEIPEFVIDKEAADVVLLEQRLDGAVRELAFLAGM